MSGGFSVVNHMLLAQGLCTIGGRGLLASQGACPGSGTLRPCQRQVQIEGPDAEKLVQWMTPRDISKSRPGQCLYIPITDADGGMINDPVLLKLADDRFWLSIADSDLLLFAKGLAIGAGMNVRVSEPDVSPLAVQGPKAEDLMADLFGEGIRDLGFFRFGWFDFQNTRQLIARSGYSRQGGFEIYLNDGTLGGALWDAVWEAGQAYEIAPGCPNLIERIEGGLLSYGNDMTRANTPLELGLGRYCALDGSVNAIGSEALAMVAAQGISRDIRGVLFDGGACPTCSTPWPVIADGRDIGQITSAIWSPRLKRNVGLSLIERGFWSPGQPVHVTSSDGAMRPGEVAALPFA